MSLWMWERNLCSHMALSCFSKYFTGDLSLPTGCRCYTGIFMEYFCRLLLQIWPLQGQPSYMGLALFLMGFFTRELNILQLIGMAHVNLRPQRWMPVWCEHQQQRSSDVLWRWLNSTCKKNIGWWSKTGCPKYIFRSYIEGRFPQRVCPAVPTLHA